MAVIRWILGSLILFLNWIFSPKSIKRDPFLQAKIDKKAAGLTLFQYAACPFCVKVRRVIKRCNLPIKLVDPRKCDNSREALMQGGGKLKVPCLKIEDGDKEALWMYESSIISSYLESQVAEITRDL
ncbi:MAG: glutaredoxin [Saprospiraceae bacterium]|jgi:glutaredoxin|tara:strand:+ start:6023 stop:6403 length:381 start_codon:yes stop_codon:yes gene_type:complete